jgi:hypothetical protein
MTLVPGMIVEVVTVSQRSFWIFRAYQDKGFKVGCFCRWKHGTLGVVDSVFEDGTAIIRKQTDPSVIGIGYSGDLSPYYEEDPPTKSSEE